MSNTRARDRFAPFYIFYLGARVGFLVPLRRAPPAKVILNMHKIYIHRTHTISFLALSAYDVFGWWLNVQKKEEEIKTLGYGVCLPLHNMRAHSCWPVRFVVYSKYISSPPANLPNICGLNHVARCAMLCPQFDCRARARTMDEAFCTRNRPHNKD